MGFVHAHAKIKKTGECAVCRALVGDRFDRRLPRAFDRAQPVADGFGGGFACAQEGFKKVIRAVDVWRQNRQAVEFHAVLIQGLHLVGVVHVQRQGGGHEFGGVVAFEPCGVVGNQCVGSRVGFVKTIVGKLFHDVKERCCELFINVVVRACAFNEYCTLALHFFRIFFTHRTAQQIRAAE